MVQNGYDWGNSWETERRRKEPPPDQKDERTPFDHDWSRIIHSVAFRRLQGKTQIFAPGWADFMRTRVTHAIETGQIGRSLARNAKVPESLVEAACLAHDLGHPPFGHTGERILNELMKEHGGFEGNAQTFRILTRLEKKSTKYRGLNLCRATLLGVLKYPRRTHERHENFLYEDDATKYEAWLFKGTDKKLIKSPDEEPKHGPHRTVVCQLMDWADDVAYSVHDLEDGLVSRFLLPAAFSEEPLIDRVVRQVNKSPARTKVVRKRVQSILQALQDKLGKSNVSLSPSIIREVTRDYINRFVTNVVATPGKSPKNAFDFSLCVPREIREECNVLKALTFEFVIKDERTTTFIYKGMEIVKRIFTALTGNAKSDAGPHRFELFPVDMRDDLDKVRDDASKQARLVCDYVACMTDGQAIHLFRRLFEPTGGSPFEAV